MSDPSLAWRAAFTSLLTLLSVFAAPSTASAAADPDVLLGRPASDALLWGDTLVVLAPDHRGVSGLSLGGERRWHVALAPPDDEGPFALRALSGRDGRVAVVLGDRVVVVDPKTGGADEPRETGRFSATTRPGCELEQRAGACAVSCPCGFQLVACDTLAPIGPRWALPSASRDAADDPDSTRCSGRRGAVVGRAGDLLLASVPGPRAARTTFFVPYVLAAVDRGTGELRWTSEPLGKTWPTAGLTGVAPDGRSAWIGGAGGHVDVFDAQTGAVRWSADQKAPKTAEPQAVPVAGNEADGQPGLLVRAGERIQRRRIGDGRVVWTIHAPTERVVPSGWRGDVEVLRGDGFRLVDPANGAAVASIPLPGARGRRRVKSLESGWLVGGDGYVGRFDTAGRAVAERRVAGSDGFLLGDSAIALRGRDKLTVVDAESLLPIYELGGTSYTLVAVEGPLGRGVLAAVRHADRPFDKTDPESFGEVRIVRFRSVGGR